MAFSSFFSKLLNPIIRSASVAPSFSRSLHATGPALFPVGVPGRIMPTERRNVRDHKRRLVAEHYEVKRRLHKALSKDASLPRSVRDLHRYKLSKLPRDSSLTRVRNRCIYTGRPRAVSKVFRMSRIMFRELAGQGEINGVKKSSW